MSQSSVTIQIVPESVLQRLAGLGNQTQRDTPLLDKVCGEITVTDPAHPLYGQTLPLLPVRINRTPLHVMVLLPSGRRHMVPRAATNLERPVEAVLPPSPLPVISVRTILPLARLVQQLKQAKEESHAERQRHPSIPPNTVPSVPTTIFHQLPRATSSNLRTWSPISFDACTQPSKRGRAIMNAELLPLTPTTEQRAKMAYVYIRQSSLMQVTRHGESTELQYSLVERAVQLGWPRERVEIIDEDLGKSGADALRRRGFQYLLAEISLARAGLVLSYDASRLARNNRDWYQLLEVCSIFGTLIADGERLYDPRLYHDRLLLGLTGMLARLNCISSSSACRPEPDTKLNEANYARGCRWDWLADLLEK